MDDSKQEAVDFFIKKSLTAYGKRVNKVCIWILNYHSENKVKTEAFWLVFKSICNKIFTNSQKNSGGEENRKEPLVYNL